MVIYNRMGVDAASEDLLDEDECDGWGPVRPRRSSAPVPLLADSDENEQEKEALQSAPKEAAR